MLYVDVMLMALMMLAIWKLSAVEKQILECKQVITHLLLEQINDENKK